MMNFKYKNINGISDQHAEIQVINSALAALSKKVNKPLRQLLAAELNAEVTGVVAYLSDARTAANAAFTFLGGGAIAFEDADFLNVIATTGYCASWGIGKANVAVPPQLTLGCEFVAIVYDVQHGVHVNGPHRSLTWKLKRN